MLLLGQRSPRPSRKNGNRHATIDLDNILTVAAILETRQGKCGYCGIFSGQKARGVCIKNIFFIIQTPSAFFRPKKAWGRILEKTAIKNFTQKVNELSKLKAAKTGEEKSFSENGF